MFANLAAQMGWFQSAPPHGRRQSGEQRFQGGRCFNPRLRTGGDRCAGALRDLPAGSFNPRLRTGGDPCTAVQGDARPMVSIRASAREATGLQCHGRQRYGVSIRASAREATVPPHRCPGGTLGFQSAPPHGRRRADKYSFRTPNVFQSAPPHGRRLHELNLHQRQRVSIRASAREATPVNADSQSDAALFQSAPPHGRRPPERPNTITPVICFNPRLRTGGDQVARGSVDNPCGVSIRASAREATR